MAIACTPPTPAAGDPHSCLAWMEDRPKGRSWRGDGGGTQAESRPAQAKSDIGGAEIEGAVDLAQTSATTAVRVSSASHRSLGTSAAASELQSFHLSVLSHVLSSPS